MGATAAATEPAQSTGQEGFTGESAYHASQPRYNNIPKYDCHPCLAALVTLVAISLISTIVVISLQYYPEETSTFYAVAGSVGGSSLLALILCLWKYGCSPESPC